VWLLTWEYGYSIARFGLSVALAGRVKGGRFA